MAPRISDGSPSDIQAKVNGASETLKSLNWPTVILILVTGGGNFLATQNNSNQRQYQIDRAIDQIRDLHQALDQTDKRQRQAIDHFETLLANDHSNINKISDSLSNQTKLLGNQNAIMANQSKILENDTVVLKEIHEAIEKFQKMRRMDEMRGAPP